MLVYVELPSYGAWEFVDIPDRYVFDICNCICLLFCNLLGEFTVIVLESVCQICHSTYIYIYIYSKITLPFDINESLNISHANNCVPKISSETYLGAVLYNPRSLCTVRL